MKENYEKCLKFQCKNCRNYLLCFRKDSCNEHSNNRIKKVKKSGVQSKKGTKTGRRRVPKIKEKYC